MKRYKEIEKQSEFCLASAVKLNEKIKKAEVQYGYVANHTQMGNDIIRLRRELKELYDMLMNYGWER